MRLIGYVGEEWSVADLVRYSGRLELRSAALDALCESEDEFSRSALRNLLGRARSKAEQIEMQEYVRRSDLRSARHAALGGGEVDPEVFSLLLEADEFSLLYRIIQAGRVAEELLEALRVMGEPPSISRSQRRFFRKIQELLAG